jgi:hypothetical protein
VSFYNVLTNDHFGGNVLLVMTPWYAGEKALVADEASAYFDMVNCSPILELGGCS